MKDNHGPVWVIAEHADGQILAVSNQLAGQARKLAEELNVQAEAILLGNEIAELPNQLFAAGADRVFLGDASALGLYQSELYAEIIVGLAEKHRPEILLLASTPMGRELAPLVAARLKTGLTAHCIDLVLDENKVLQQKIPAYGGMLTIVCPEKRPQMATVAKGVFPAPEVDGNRKGIVVPVEMPAKIPARIRTLEIVSEEPKGVPLESASTIVAGGAGAGGPEGWNEIADLAETLGAALGSTRPAVDAGWTELETMIGQSGKMVGPEFYLGVGLSGELQHMVGIVGAKVMAAVNLDPKSPVFEQVDYGVVDDCREFVPVLIEKIKEYK